LEKLKNCLDNGEHYKKSPPMILYFNIEGVISLHKIFYNLGLNLIDINNIFSKIKSIISPRLHL
ncbi:hypothetical protein, partial [Acetivibrio straminisolvens]|uniref:hypothetical protein n=1 Tax=Acetivibrio straminisolvens TaxID=253314 RepID=UPI00056DECB4